MKELVVTAMLMLSIVGGAQGAIQPNTGEPLEVGAVLPMTGVWGSAGVETKAALELAVSQANSYLAQNGLSVELVVVDSASDPYAALDGLETLAKRGVHVVIGPLTSDEANVLRGFADANNILLISPSSTAPSLALPDNLIRFCPNDVHQARAMAMLAGRRGTTAMVTVYQDDPYGKGLADAFAEAYSNETSKALGAIPFTLSAPDYPALVTKIETALVGCDAATTGVFLVGSDEHAANLFSTIPADDPLGDLKWYVSEGPVGFDKVVSMAGSGAFAAKTGLTGFSLSSEDECFHLYSHLIMQMVDKVIGKPPTPFVVPAWDALWLVAETYKAAPDADFAAFKEALIAQAQDFCGALGFSQLDENGDKVAARYAVYTVKPNGKGGYAWRVGGTYVDEPFDDPQLTLAELEEGPVVTDTVTVTIGALVPKTGALADQGAEAQAALELALQHVNDYLDGKGSKLRFALAVEDTGSNPEVALEKARKLVGQNISVLIAPVSNDELAAIAEFVAEAGVSLVSPSSSAPSLATQDRIMRLVPSDSHQAEALVALMEERGVVTPIVTYAENVYGKDLSEALAIAGRYEQRSGASVTFSCPLQEVDHPLQIESLSELVESLPTVTSPDTLAIVLVSGEMSSLLEAAVPNPLLAQAQWYGSDSVFRDRSVLDYSFAVFNAANGPGFVR